MHRFFSLLVCTAFCCLITAVEASDHYYSVDDMLALENIGEVRFSPDGSFVLFEKGRAYEQQKNFAAVSMLGKNNTEIFIASTKNPRKPKSLLSLDGVPNWFGAFSPTGAHIVVHWYESDRIRTGIYTFKSKKLTAVEGDISSAYESLDRSPVWVSDTAIVFQDASVYKQRTGTVFQVVNAEARQRMEAATWSGAAPGVTHLKTRGSAEVADIDEGQLVYFDVKTKKREVLAEGDFRKIFAAPNSKKFAAVEYKGKRPAPNEEKVEFEPEKYDILALHLFDSEKLSAPRVICSDRCSLRSGVYLRWSASGKKLTFVAYDDAPQYEKLTLYVYDAETNKRVAVTAPEVAATPSVYGVRSLYGQLPNGVWLGDQLVSRVERADAARQAGAEGAEQQSKEASYDWYAVSANGRTARSLTARLSDAPGDYLAVWDEKLLISVGGDFVAVSKEGETEVLTAAVDGVVEPFCVVYAAWRDTFKPSTCGEFQEKAISRGLDPYLLSNDKLVFAFSRKNEDIRETAGSDINDKRYAVLDLRSGAVSDLVSVSSTDQILAVSPDGASSVLKRQSDHGGALALMSGRKQDVLLRYNQHLEGVKGGTPVYMPFKREDGTIAHDWLLLPPGHEEGDRHPLIVKFYPGNERRGDRWSGDAGMTKASVINEYVLASAGYAVLVAGMPAIDYADNQTSEPMYEMHEPLIAAATRAVEAGYADPDTWFLMGYSYGGYGTVSVLTQTDKFRGGIAMAGKYNLTSGYGLFNRGASAWMRSFYQPASVSWSETGQGRMGGAPWEKPDRYVRNSPLFYVDDIEGAVLMIHGDLDGVDIGGAEQIFTAMDRLDKDAEFIRLWGENHFILSAASIRYSYESMFRWLDRLDD